MVVCHRVVRDSCLLPGRRRCSLDLEQGGAPPEVLHRRVEDLVVAGVATPSPVAQCHQS